MKMHNFFKMLIPAVALLASAACTKEVDDNGNRTPSVVVGGNDCFELTAYDIKTTTVYFDIHPKGEAQNMYYYWNTIETSYLEDKDYTIESWVQSRLTSIQNLIDKGGSGSWIGERSPDIWGRESVGNLRKGDLTVQDVNLTGEVEYIMYVVGVELKSEVGEVLTGFETSRDEDGDRQNSPIYEERERLVAYMATPVATIKFTTPPAVQSNIKFDISEDHGRITVRTSNNDPYFLAVNEADDFIDENGKEMSDKDIINYLIASYGGDLSVYTNIGSYVFDFSTQMDKGTDYTLYLFGYDGGPTTSITRYTFTFEGVDRLGYSSLMKDYEFNTASAPSMITLYGSNDGQADHSNHYWVVLQDNATQEFFQSEVFYPLPTDEPVYDEESKRNLPAVPNGTVEVDADCTGKAGTAYYGYLDPAHYLQGTWWCMPDENGDVLGQAAGDSGTITITPKSELVFDEANLRSGVYYYTGDFEISAEFIDPRGNTVKAHYSGEVTFIDATTRDDAAAATNSLHKFSTAAKLTAAKAGFIAKPASVN